MDNTEILITQLRINARKFDDQLSKAQRELQDLKNLVQRLANEVTELKSTDSQHLHILSTHATAIDNLTDKLNA